MQRISSIDVTTRRTSICFGVLLLLTLCCFWPATHGPFLFDDFPNLSHLREIGGTLDWPRLGRYLAAFTGNPGRPLSALSFLIEDWAWPSSPASFKRDNLLLHLLVGIALFTLARRLSRMRPEWKQRADAIALLTTAMWLLHPMQLSSTMLVVQRMNILATLCIVIGLICYLRVVTPSADRPVPPQRACKALAVLAIWTVIAVLFKENGALLPLYALAVNLTLLRPHLARMPASSRRLLVGGTLFPLVLLCIGLAAYRTSALYGYHIRDFTLGERLLTEPRVLMEYVTLILLPRLGGLGIFHDGYTVSRSLFSPPATALAIALVVIAMAVAVGARRKWPALTFAVAWFLCGHVMESTVIPLELYFEHRNYLPMFGLLLAVSASLLGAPAQLRFASRVLISLWLVFAVGLTAYSARIWGDRGSLSLVWLEEQPTSPRAAQLAAAYYFDTEQMDAARRVFDDALRRMPNASDLFFQKVLVDCFDRGVSRADWERLLTLAGKSAYRQGSAETTGTFIRESLDGQCHGTVAPADAEALGKALLSNPSFQDQPEAVGYLYYELAHIPEHDRNLSHLMEYLDASYRYRPSPFVPREQAIDLLTAGLPVEALRYLDRSDATPQPWIKRRLTNIRELNRPLREAAQQMAHQQQH